MKAAELTATTAGHSGWQHSNYPLGSLHSKNDNLVAQHLHGLCYNIIKCPGVAHVFREWSLIRRDTLD